MTTILVLTNKQLTYFKHSTYELLEQTDNTATIKVHFDRPTDLFYAGFISGFEMGVDEALATNVYKPFLQPKDQSNSSGTKTEAHQGREGNQ